jgi:hypothetical protein
MDPPHGDIGKIGAPRMTGISCTFTASGNTQP